MRCSQFCYWIDTLGFLVSGSGSYVRSFENAGRDFIVDPRWQRDRRGIRVDTGRYDAVICLGAVIRGATPHFDYVSAEVSKGVAAVGLESSIPVIFGVITTDNIEQAIERAGTKAGNKGWSAAISAVEMANLIEVLDK